MRFLICTAFWLGLLFLVVPLPVDEQSSADKPAGAFEALLAARDAVHDLAGICERQPEVCATARAAAVTIAARAREAIRLAEDLAEKSEPAPPRPDAEVPATGSIPEPE